MEQSVEVVFYDGITSRPQRAVTLPVNADSVEVRTDSKRYLLHYRNMVLLGALGQIKPVIELPDEMRLEFLQTALPDWFLLQHKKTNHRIWQYERSPTLVVASLLLVLAFMATVFKFGIPYAAKEIAFHLPADTLNDLGYQAEQQLNDMTADTGLSKARQQQITQLYLKHVAGNYPATILFRKGGPLKANALALPNHHILLTDELVALTKNDQELIGVLAHEQGHLVQRHSLQQIITAAGTSALITWVTGDVSDFISNIPAGLVSLKYSRDFERQADLYALGVMHQQQIPAHYFSDFLSRMEREPATAVLSTHPATEERVAAVKAFERERGH